METTLGGSVLRRMLACLLACYGRTRTTTTAAAEGDDERIRLSRLVLLLLVTLLLLLSYLYLILLLKEGIQRTDAAEEEDGTKMYIKNPA